MAAPLTREEKHAMAAKVVRVSLRCPCCDSPLTIVASAGSSSIGGRDDG
jgi:hypothetical protein